MPNGGSDCCGTCWFNQKNQGRTGYAHADDPGDDYCTIRHILIEVSFYTYCLNHPNHNPERIDLPIGPVSIHAFEGEGRIVWQPSPDTEDIRLMLLRLLHPIAEDSKDRDIVTAYRDITVVKQLRDFRERRAVPDLERIAAFYREDCPVEARNSLKQILAELARQALQQIHS
jgi:hypothetical protein